MKPCAVFVAVLICIGGTAVFGWAQDGVIAGRVADASEAVLPGVSITLTSPQVMGERMQISDERGNYRFTLLPPGTYALKFELPSFATLVRQGIQMSAGFTATINAALQVSNVQDTVTVSGQSPVVDVENATVSTNFNTTLTTILPNPYDYNAILAVTPGLQVVTPDVGGSRAHIQQTVRSYGTSGQVWLLIDGVQVNQGNAAFGPYYDTSSYAEFQVSQASKSAEIPTAGLNMNLIVKTGANAVHGSAYGDWITTKFQSDNLNDSLRSQGITYGKRQRFNDFHGDIGGHIIKDKFWWYSSTRYFYTGLYPYGFYNADGSQAIYDTDVKEQTVKFNYQITPKNTLTYMGFVQKKVQYQRIAVEHAAYFSAESVGHQDYPDDAQKWQITSVLSPKVTLDAKIAQNHLGQWRELAIVQQLSMRDLDTQQVRGGYSGYDTGTPSPPFIIDYHRRHADAELAINTPGFGGNHNIRIGYGRLFDRWILPKFNTYGSVVTLWRGGFKTPAFIDTFDTPFRTDDRMSQNWVFANDTWNIGRRLTLNLGFRYDRYVAYRPDNVKEGIGPYQDKFVAPAMKFSPLQAAVPRVSAVYDIFGTGRTAVKFAVSRYGFNPSASLSNMVNPVQLTRKRYSWDGTLPVGFPDVPYVPDPSKLTQTAGGRDQRVDSNLKLPTYDEYSAGIDQQLFSDMTIRFTAVRKFERNVLQTFNEAIPYSAYNIPVAFTDPGRDNILGTADDHSLTAYSLDPKYRGLFSGVLRNNPNRLNSFVQYSIDGSKRMSNKWQALTGLDILHYNYLPDIQDPNAAINGGQNYWTWQYKAIGSYELPKGIGLSGSIRALKGEPRSRTINSPSLNQGVISILAEPMGSFFLPSYGLVDLQLQKTFKLGERGGSLEALWIWNNILNINTVTQASNVTGATFNKVAQIMDPRVYKLAVRYKF